MLSRWILVVILFLCSCQDEPGREQQQRDQKQPAEQKLGQGNQLQEIVKEIAAGGDWKTRLENWKPDVFYVWEGKTFTATDGLAPVNAVYFQEKISRENPANAAFLLLHLLLREKRYPLLGTVIATTSPADQEIAWDLCLAWSWEMVRRSDWQEAGKLFESVLKIETGLAVRQQKESVMGMSLCALMSKPGVDLSDEILATVPEPGWQYYLERRPIDFFRVSSPAHACEMLKEKAFSEFAARLVLVDVFFVAGDMCRNSAAVWQTGCDYLKAAAKDAGPEWAPLCAALDSRFRRAIAWNQALEGDTSTAQKFFASAQGDAEKADAELAMAFMEFSDNPSLESVEIESIQKTWPHYWLGGRQFSFYRLPQRQVRKELIERACAQESNLYKYLVLLDAFCLTGQKDWAKHLLGLIVDRYREHADIVKLCVEEEKEIPKDVYAESQIREQLE